jgi:glutamate/tyrosine decarboxylase-like PLP-dependent enzyme
VYSILDDAARRARAYLQGLEGRPVAPSAAAVRNLGELDEALPADAGDPVATLALLDRLVSPATMAIAGPRFFGFVIGGSLPVTLAANWLAGAWDQNAALHLSTPGVSYLENVALRWLVELFELPAGSGGAFVTGATVANFTALAAARNAVLARVGWNVEADGLFGAPRITVIVGQEAHPSLLKSLGMLGLGRSRVVRVPSDDQGRMRPSAVPKFSGPTILCVQAGNVNSGSFDDFGALIPPARAEGAWVHVDGAFGLWAKASALLRPLARGFELADSWATDAHKWLNVPYDNGIAIVRDSAAHRASMTVSAAYLIQTGGRERDAVDWTPEFSRRARGLTVYAALRVLGRRGIERLVDNGCARARQMAELLTRDPRVAVLNDVVLNQALLRFGDSDELTRDVIARVQRDGTCWLGGTTWHNLAAMRISVSHWATSEEDIERSAAAILRCLKAASGV